MIYPFSFSTNNGFLRQTLIILPKFFGAEKFKNFHVGH
jgi:hypothetical protein